MLFLLFQNMELPSIKMVSLGGIMKDTSSLGDMLKLFIILFLFLIALVSVEFIRFKILTLLNWHLWI